MQILVKHKRGVLRTKPVSVYRRQS